MLVSGGRRSGRVEVLLEAKHDEGPNKDRDPDDQNHGTDREGQGQQAPGKGQGRSAEHQVHQPGQDGPERLHGVNRLIG